jgi:cytochrome c-type biogenesis protein CcmH
VNLFLLVGGAILALAMAALVALPAWRRLGPAAGSGGDLAVYRDQLAELDRDQARGLIGSAEAAAARLEIERRMLRAADALPVSAAVPTRRSRVSVALVAIAVPLLAAGLYWRLGAPSLRDQPLLARQMQNEGQPDIAGMVARLEARLAQSPDDAEGWLMLGRSRAALGDAAAAGNAYRRALGLQPDSPEALGGLAESLIVLQSGSVGDEARALLERLDGQGTDDPRPGYYLGVAAAQAGDLAGAERRWRKLLAEGPADAPWRARVVDAIRQASASFGIDGDRLVAESPGRAADPVAAEAARIAALPPEERAARIKSMVDGLQARLEADGGDANGWARLAQARSTIGEQDAALAAWDRALALSPDDANLLKGKAVSLLGPSSGESGLPTVPDSAAELLGRVLARQPGDPEAHWYLGIRALQQDQPAEARRHWEQALAGLDPNSEERAAMQARLAELPPAP